MRKKICAGNWKMYKNLTEVSEFFDQFQSMQKADSDFEVVIFPSTHLLSAAIARARQMDGKVKINIGVQNIFTEKEGPFTGETSALSVHSIGVTYALIGHSERRTLFYEADDFISKKVRTAIDAGLIPMLCVGETLKERESGKTEEVVTRQILVGLSKLAAESDFVIAYEPVWAIGTGKVATPEMAEEVHKIIRNRIGDIFGPKKAENSSILYGGSVKPDNAESLAKMPNIDGFLVGGASLKPKDFIAICNSY